MYIHVSLQKIL